VPTMTTKQQLIQQVIYALIALSAVIGAVILGWRGALNPDAVAAILTGALALAGGAAAGIGAVGAVVNGKSVVTHQLISEQGATARTAIVAASATPSTTVTPVEPHNEPEGEH
jgi:hypothetical protein